MNESDLNQLRNYCKAVRKSILNISHSHKSAHLGSSLSIVESLVTLVFRQMNNFSPESYSINSDQLILSKGHAAMSLYAVLLEKKFISIEDFNSYGNTDSIFEEHPNFKIPTVVTSTGSLGHGLPFATGLALGYLKKKTFSRVFAIMSDGECNEGTVWEAARLAYVNKINNIVAIVDNNGWQATGRIEESFGDLAIANCFASFGWKVFEVDGHNISEIDTALENAKNFEKPVAIICKTIKGKGISFMENDNNWHYKFPNESELQLALSELENTNA